MEIHIIPKRFLRASQTIVLVLILALWANQARSQTLADGFVTSVPIEGLIEKPANLFNLQGKTLRFTPQAGGTYKVETLASGSVVACDKMLDDASGEGSFTARGWAVPLSFAFPFGGKTWDRVYVNRNGNVSFEKAEGSYWPERDPWSDGGMASMAGVLDSRSVAGLEKMIAVFWGPYDSDARLSQVGTKLDKDFLAVSWNVTRVGFGQARGGASAFQVRLHRSGVIEMVYPRMTERDGIAGLFDGQTVDGPRLQHWQYTGAAKDPSVDVESADVYDLGSVLKLVINMKNDALTHVDSDSLDYRCFVDDRGEGDQISVNVSASEDPKMSCWLGATPRTGGFQIRGKSVEMFVSKYLLPELHKVTLSWNVQRWGRRGQGVGSGKQPPLDLGDGRGDTDLSAGGTFSGNIFEVFQYPKVTKTSERLLKIIYKSAPANDDIAIVFTDFRIDDLYGQGGGAIAANFPIQGIGKGSERPRSTKNIGSTQLQSSVATVWIGAPLFAESGIDDGVRWSNFAHGVKWVAHESTHRWGMDLSFRNPRTGADEKLVSNVGHWLEGLNTVAFHAVGSQYLQQPTSGYSIMGGAYWRENSDGTFTKSTYPFYIPGGYSALDLYVMGLLPPEKVPPTFLIEDLKDLGSGRFGGTKIPVRIEDIVAAMGPRVPANPDAQKSFRMAFYVVHESGQEANPQTLNQARRLAAAVADYFSRATGGVMKIVPSGS